MSSSAQPASEIPMVMVRRSRFCSETMERVSATSCGVMSTASLSSEGWRGIAATIIEMADGTSEAVT